MVKCIKCGQDVYTGSCVCYKEPEIKDTINPQHYKTVTGIECIQVTEHFNFCRGNALKYIWRAGEKDKSKEVEDLKKAVWYLEREIERIKGGL